MRTILLVACLLGCGTKGPIATEGKDGTNGEAGKIGSVGPQGAQGDTGPTGPTGPEGPKGDTGPAGPVGPVGPAGAPSTPTGDIITSTRMCTSANKRGVAFKVITSGSSDAVYYAILNTRVGLELVLPPSTSECLANPNTTLSYGVASADSCVFKLDCDGKIIQGAN